MNRIILACGAFLSTVIAAGAQTSVAPFTVCSSQSISVTNASSSINLTCGGPSLKVLNVSTVEAFVAFGATSATATTSKDSIPPNGCVLYSVPQSASVMAAITAASTTTLRVSQGYGIPKC